MCRAFLETHEPVCTYSMSPCQCENQHRATEVYIYIISQHLLQKKNPAVLQDCDNHCLCTLECRQVPLSVPSFFLSSFTGRFTQRASFDTTYPFRYMQLLANNCQPCNLYKRFTGIINRETEADKKKVESRNIFEN